MQMWFPRKVNLKSKFMLFTFFVHVPGPTVVLWRMLYPNKKDLSFMHSFGCFVQTEGMHRGLKGSEVLHLPLDLPDEMFLNPKIH